MRLPAFLDAVRWARIRAAAEAYRSPSHDVWVVASRIDPLGWRINSRHNSYEAANDEAVVMRSRARLFNEDEGGTVRVPPVRVQTLWEHRRLTNARMESAAPWRDVLALKALKPDYDTQIALLKAEALADAAGHQEHKFRTHRLVEWSNAQEQRRHPEVFDKVGDQPPLDAKRVATARFRMANFLHVDTSPMPSENVVPPEQNGSHDG